MRLQAGTRLRFFISLIAYFGSVAGGVDAIWDLDDRLRISRGRMTALVHNTSVQDSVIWLIGLVAAPGLVMLWATWERKPDAPFQKDRGEGSIRIHNLAVGILIAAAVMAVAAWTVYLVFR